MNILVKTCSGKIIVRPDTTWERDNEDFYVPEFIHHLSYAPVAFVRICKPGRSVSAEFAERYFDSFGYGILLYPDDLIDGSEEGFCCASCLDHTSYLALPSEKSSNGKFILKKDSEILFEDELSGKDAILDAIQQATKYIYIRSGDLLAIELQKREALCSDSDKEIHITGLWQNLKVTDFTIFF